jgi:nucleoside-diphosphate-sugar epimerase
MSGGILVTGASGFLGRAVLQRLLNNYERPLVAAVRSAMPNLSAGVRVESGKELGPDTCWISCIDGVDIVIHCAAQTRTRKDTSTGSLAQYREINVQGTLALADQAARVGVKRFVFISSIKVNGELTAPTHAFRADDIPNPQDAYGLSKLEAEQGLKSLAQQFGMEVVIIRPPLIYGPGVKGNFAALVNSIRKGVPVPLGAIYNRRSFIALDNLVDFIALCADLKRSPLAANEVFLVSDGEDISTTELLRRIETAYDARARLIPIHPKWVRTVASWIGKESVADQLLSSLVIDASKAFDLLEWIPITSMNMQLKKMAEYDAIA